MAETTAADDTTPAAPPRGYREDSQGRLVPERLISPLDRERDRIVREIAEEGARLSVALAAFKRRSLEAAEAFVARSAAEYDTTIGGKKGNLVLSSYDGRHRISISTHDRLAFDERLQIAKSLIDKCISRWTRTANREARVLIQEAFRVDRRGRIDVQRLLQLRQLHISDPQWQEAMRALGDSITSTRSQRYLRLQRRREDGGYDPVHLSIAAASS